MSDDAEAKAKVQKTREFCWEHGIKRGFKFEDEERGLSEFGYIGGTGLLICHPAGEPDMQSSWVLTPEQFAELYLSDRDKEFCEALEFVTACIRDATEDEEDIQEVVRKFKVWADKIRRDAFLQAAEHVLHLPGDLLGVSPLAFLRDSYKALAANFDACYACRNRKNKT